MRDILFRGKRKCNNKWVYGGYCRRINSLTRTIEDCVSEDYTDDEYYVIPDTVGQYTGLTDKNNKPIFEGDKVRVPMHKAGETPNYMTGFVEWINGAFSVTWDDTQYGRHFAGYLENIEIIGNIYDTPKVVRVRRIK